MSVSVSLTNDMVGSTLIGQIILIDTMYIFAHNPSNIANNISHHLDGYNGNTQARSQVVWVIINSHWRV